MSLGLHARTELGPSGKKIAKEKFYSNLDFSVAQERLFIDNIKSIRWMNKISPGSMNLEKSDNIDEIEVFEIVAKTSDIDQKTLTLIDRGIVHPILFVIVFEEKEKLAIAFKEVTEANKISVKQYYSTDWRKKNTSKVDFSAASTGELYKNLIVQISERLDSESESSLSEMVSDDIEYRKALKEIEKLESKMSKTDQPNKKLELAHELRELKNKWGVN